MENGVVNQQGTLRELALFAGAGGGILGGKLLGWRTVCAVEWEPYPASVLAARQNEGILPPFPIWDDVQTFDGRPWRGIVDVVSGGFPCQDISSAGRGAGIDGERSGMWKHMARIIGEVRPQYAFVENSPMLVSRGLAVVISDLAEMGYDAQWCVVSASDCGAPHKRDRIWILAHAAQLHSNGSNDHAGISMGRKQIPEFGNSGWEKCVANASSIGQPRQRQSWFSGDPAEKREGETDHAFAERCRNIWGVEPGMDRVAHGVAGRVDRLRAIGNGQVPIVAATAWRVLSEN
jgi:DNA (cytosine-5)-methyltransferase 1